MFQALGDSEFFVCVSIGFGTGSHDDALSIKQIINSTKYIREMIKNLGIDLLRTSTEIEKLTKLIWREII